MPTWWRQLLGLTAFVAACFAVAGVGGCFTSGPVETWYPGLSKPWWTPPDWLFGPVWTVLYLSMAIAAWLVWRQEGSLRAARPLSLFAAQLALNLAWSALFFGLRSPAAALADIALLWCAILATAISFRRVNLAAGLLLVPYLGWVSFASALNLAIWRLNG
jgi:tryptophan-rich sensory protein